MQSIDRGEPLAEGHFESLHVGSVPLREQGQTPTIHAGSVPLRERGRTRRSPIVSLNVLITAGSRRVPLVQAFQRAVRTTGGGRVVVTDVNPLSPTVYVADRSYEVPLDRSGYLEAVERISADERVSLIVPTIDDELLLFAEVAPRFADRGIRVAVSGPKTIGACNDRYQTWRVLLARGLPVAETYLPSDLPAAPSFPLFIKPRFGRGGVGAFPVRNDRELAFFVQARHRACASALPERAGVHDRRALRFHRAGPERCTPGTRRHPRGCGRSRPHCPRRVARLTRRPVCRGARVRRCHQHPVSHREWPAGDLRDQPAILRRHPAHDCRRARTSRTCSCRRPADERSARPSAASATRCG